MPGPAAFTDTDSVFASGNQNAVNRGMKQLILLAFLGTATVDGAVILTGTLQEWHSIGGPPDWTLQLQGPGFDFRAGDNPNAPPWVMSRVPYCTGGCAYDFSQSLSGTLSPARWWNATIGGTTYPVSDGFLYRATIDLHLSSTVVTATAVCTMGCGGPFTELYQTEWRDVPFAVTGSVQIQRRSFSDPLDTPWTLAASEALSGSGLATAKSWAYVPNTDNSQTVVTYDFSVPEPSSFSLLLIAVPGLVYGKWRQLRR